MTLLSRAGISPYWYFMETMSVCHTVYEIFSVKEWRNLETGSRGRSRSLKKAPFDRSYTTFYWSAIVCCMLYVVPFSSNLTLNNRDLEKVTEGHSNWYHSKAWVQFPLAFLQN